MIRLMNSLPSCCRNLSLQKLFELFEKFKLSRFGTSFHWSWQIYYCTIRSTILNWSARYVFASILMYTPTITNGAIALNTLIASVWQAFRDIPRLGSILTENGLWDKGFCFANQAIFIVFHTFCSSSAAARSARQSDSVSVSRRTGSLSTIVFDRSTTKFNKYVNKWPAIQS